MTGSAPRQVQAHTFRRRGIVEGFFGAPWSVAQRCALFEFGAKRAMNTYLYAPKDDLKHRAIWRELYSAPEAVALGEVIALRVEKLRDPRIFAPEQVGR